MYSQDKPGRIVNNRQAYTFGILIINNDGNSCTTPTNEGDDERKNTSIRSLNYELLGICWIVLDGGQGLYSVLTDRDRKMKMGRRASRDGAPIEWLIGVEGLNISARVRRGDRRIANRGDEGDRNPRI